LQCYIWSPEIKSSKAETQRLGVRRRELAALVKYQNIVSKLPIVNFKLKTMEINNGMMLMTMDWIVFV